MIYRKNSLAFLVSICAAAAILVIGYFSWSDSEIVVPVATVWEAAGENNVRVRRENQSLEVEVVYDEYWYNLTFYLID